MCKIVNGVMNSKGYVSGYTGVVKQVCQRTEESCNSSKYVTRV